MNKRDRLTCAVLLALAVSGCARLAFHTDPGLKSEETGVKFYIAKPYLLVARTGAKDKPTDVSLIFLPDMSRPLYAKPIAGYGSSNLTMSFTNGMLTAFGQQSDNKIPESLTALGSSAKGIAEARKINREALALALESVPDASKHAQPLQAIADDLKKRVTKQAVDGGEITEGEAATLKSFIHPLETASMQLKDPTQAPQRIPGVIGLLKPVLEAWKKQIGEPTLMPGQLTRQALLADRNQLAGILDAITPKPAEEATFTLYEIDNSGTETKVKEVKF